LLVEPGMAVEFLSPAAVPAIVCGDMSSNPAAAEVVTLPAKPRFRLPRMQEAGLLVVILILGLILSAYGAHDAHGGANTFLNADNLVTQIATYMAVYAIMSVGQTFVIITGGIDISVGSIFALAAMVCADVMQRIDPNSGMLKSILVALLVAGGVGLLCGLINGALITLVRLHPFIVTLGTMSIFRCIANIWTVEKTLPNQGRTIPPSFTDNFIYRYFFANPDGTGGVQLMPLVVTLAVVALGWFYLRLTVAGRENYAIGGNEEAARFSGIAVNRVKLRVYALCGLSCGIAALVNLGWFSTTSSDTGRGYELDVIAAAVVGGASLTGGRGTALGALLGALVIRLIENGIFKMHLNQEYSMGIVGAAIVIAAAIDRASESIRKARLARGKL
jgi:ribose/xylose/arabinose/galactoside ABC-type transport system permease subunit